MQKEMLAFPLDLPVARCEIDSNARSTGVLSWEDSDSEEEFSCPPLQPVIVKFVTDSTMRAPKLPPSVVSAKESSNSILLDWSDSEGSDAEFECPPLSREPEVTALSASFQANMLPPSVWQAKAKERMASRVARA